MHKALITLSLSFAVLAPVAAFASPVTYDAVADFSTTNGNPNGVWTYGTGTPGSVTAFTVNGTSFATFSGFSYWGSAANDVPLVGHNTNSTPTSGFTPFPPSTTLWMHPGADSGVDAIVEFTAPTSAEYSLVGLFERVDQDDSQGDGVGVSIYEDSSVLLARSVISSSAYLNSKSFNSSVFLNAGDTLSFVVDNNGTDPFDSTGLVLTITQSPVPEPSSIALLGTGILSLAGAARRRFKA